MIRNYLKIAFRNLAKNKAYSAINILGLSAGLTSFTIIALWVLDELSYDQFNPNAARIVRLTTLKKTSSGSTESARTGAPMAKALLQDYPEVENAVRLDRREELVQHDNKQTLQSGIILTDPSFFDIFSYKLLRGNAATALQQPYSVILTESTAKKYFGNADPIGQSLTIYAYDTGRGARYTVTGLLPDPSTNAHFTFSMLGSFKTIEVARPEVMTAEGWGDGRYYTYLLLKEGIDIDAFARKITQFYARYVGDRFRTWRSVYFYKLQPLTAIHLRSHLENEISPNGSISQVYLFLTIGLFILLLAGINYTNLATARLMGRAKEVGIKKVVGALKTQLIGQYLVESVFVAIIALGISFLFSLAAQPLLQTITGKTLSLPDSPLLLFLLTGITVVLGLLAGMYPAFVLAGFQPIRILKGSFTSSNAGIGLRQALIVVQFVITMILITSIVVIYAQMNYVHQKDLGYDKDALVFIRLNGNADVIKGYDAFKNELTASPQISGITTANSLILSGLEPVASETIDSQGNPVQVDAARIEVDTAFLRVHKLKLIAGSPFTPRAPGDSVQPVILNETAIKKWGWNQPEGAIGKPFRMDNQPGLVIGVVHDFHFNSLQHTILPLAIYQHNGYFSRITLKIDANNMSQCLSLIERVWTKHFPVALFDYDFLDVMLAEQYRAEQRFSDIMLYFSILSLLIACLGLYGLVAYATSQKTREIGIRKVLGATVNGIALMLSKDFLKLVVFAGLLAVPLSWFIMARWLQDFAYKIDIEWWMFAASIVLVLSIALLTVSYQSIKAALMNPVKSLRSD